MKKMIFGVLLVLIVAVSGCNDTTTDFNENAGAVIQNLGFDLAQVYDDDAYATLMFDVVNVGAKEIPDGNIDVYVYGPTLSDSADTWTVDDDSVLDGSHIGDDVSGLTPADPSLGIPGGRRAMSYDLTPAKVLPGVEIPTEFYVRLCFPYETQTLTQVDVTSRNELRATGVMSSKENTINAAGPIHINAQGNGNIRSGGKIPLVLEVRDVGGGFATNGGACEVDKATTERNEVHVVVTVDGNSEDVDCGDDSNVGDVRLRDGAGRLFCTYDPDSSGSDVPRQTYMVKAIATYNYYVTESTSITNIGSTIDSAEEEEVEE